MGGVRVSGPWIMRILTGFFSGAAGFLGAAAPFVVVDMVRMVMLDDRYEALGTTVQNLGLWSKRKPQFIKES